MARDLMNYGSVGQENRERERECRWKWVKKNLPTILDQLIYAAGGAIIENVQLAIDRGEKSAR